jgi:DNA primase
MSAVEETALGRFVSHLEGVVQVGGGYLACCPAHEDHRPSLSIRAGHDGRILVHCWAGCKTGDVLVALGLQWSDLFPQKVRSRR